MKNKYIQSYSLFTERLSSHTLHKAVSKYRELGHYNKANELEDKIVKKNKEFPLDLVAKNFTANPFPGENHRLLLNDEEDFELLNLYYIKHEISNGEINLYFSYETKEDIKKHKIKTKYFNFSLEYKYIKTNEGKKLVLSGLNSKCKLAYKKDIKILIEILQQEYYNAPLKRYNLKELLNKKAEVDYTVDLYDQIPTLFDDYKRTFYTDESLHRLKSNKTIKKYNI